MFDTGSGLQVRALEDAKSRAYLYSDSKRSVNNLDLGFEDLAVVLFEGDFQVRRKVSNHDVRVEAS